MSAYTDNVSHIETNKDGKYIAITLIKTECKLNTRLFDLKYFRMMGLAYYYYYLKPPVNIIWLFIFIE